jgi:hypothetical protein
VHFATLKNNPETLYNQQLKGSTNWSTADIRHIQHVFSMQLLTTTSTNGPARLN